MQSTVCGPAPSVTCSSPHRCSREPCEAPSQIWHGARVDATRVLVYAETSPIDEPTGTWTETHALTSMFVRQKVSN